MNHTGGIHWHQGMFLQPQHFQLAERQQFMHTRPIAQSGLPHFWGIGELSLSAAAVANQRIEIQSARLLFEDQTYVEYPGNAVIAHRSFDASRITGERPMRVYLGLRRFSHDGGNVSAGAEYADGALAPVRYATTWRTQEVADLYGEGPAAQVRSLMHVVRIFFDHELDSLQDYELIPIASVQSDGTSVRLAEDVVPPCYTLAASAVLEQEVKDIRDELAARARQLQAYKRPQDAQRGGGGEGGSDTSLLLALRSLNRYCPLLQHLSEDARVHPWHVYGLLRQVVGELSSFSDRFNMFGESEDGSPGLPAYDHRDLHRCFARAHELISHMLNEITVGAEFIVPLVLDGTFYTGQLPKRFFTEHNRFYLMLQSPLGMEQIEQAVGADARLGPTGEMPKLTSLALPGLELIHLATAPRGLPRRADAHYFRIDQIGRQWEAIERDGEIALAWVDPPEGLRADIVVVRR